jgi:hypothetical protein
LRNLAPFLAAGGHFSAAGALMLARDSTGIRLILAEGRSIVIEEDAFGKPLRRLVQVLKRRGVVMTSQGER